MCSIQWLADSIVAVSNDLSAIPCSIVFTNCYQNKLNTNLSAEVAQLTIRLMLINVISKQFFSVCSVNIVSMLCSIYNNSSLRISPSASEA